MAHQMMSMNTRKTLFRARKVRRKLAKEWGVIINLTLTKWSLTIIRNMTWLMTTILSHLVWIDSWEGRSTLQDNWCLDSWMIEELCSRRMAYSSGELRPSCQWHKILWLLSLTTDLNMISTSVISSLCLLTHSMIRFRELCHLCLKWQYASTILRSL